MALKIESRDFSDLFTAVSRLDTEERRAKYIARDFPRADKVRDINKRYRWDLLHASKFPISRLYSYLNDSHIDRALRTIVKDIEP